MASEHRPDGASDNAVETAGVMSEALETVERARGHLYSFHQLIGEADLKLDSVLDSLRSGEGKGHEWSQETGRTAARNLAAVANSLQRHGISAKS